MDGPIEIAVSDAEARLSELVRIAQAGDDVVLTDNGLPTARLTSLAARPSREEKRALLEALRGSGKSGLQPDAARSQDWLYDDDGLPA